MSHQSRFSTSIDWPTILLLLALIVAGVVSVQHETVETAEKARQMREERAADELREAAMMGPSSPDFSVAPTTLEMAEGFCKQKFAGKTRVIRLCKRIQHAKAGQIENAKYRNWVKRNRSRFTQSYWTLFIEPKLVIVRAYMDATNASIKKQMRALNSLLPAGPLLAGETKTRASVDWSWYRGTTYTVIYNRAWSARAADKYLTEGLVSAALVACSGLSTIPPLRIGVFAAGGCTSVMAGVNARYKDVMKEIRQDSSRCLEVTVSYGGSELMMFGNVFRGPQATTCIRK